MRGGRRPQERDLEYCWGSKGDLVDELEACGKDQYMEKRAR